MNKVIGFLSKLIQRTAILPIVMTILIILSTLLFPSSVMHSAQFFNDSQVTATATGVSKGVQGDIVFTRKPLIKTTLPALVSFNIGSCKYSSNGNLHTMAVAPFIKDGRTYLPVRYMGYAIGMSGKNITWVPGRAAILFRFDSHTMAFSIGSTIYTVDGTVYNMDVKPLVVNGYMYIPARYFAGAFGYNVTWRQKADPAQAVPSKPQLLADPQNVFVVVDTQIPQQLYVYRDTSVILATYCNTGMLEAPTPAGHFAISAKLSSDTMAGTNPDGSKYYDPDVPWVMYFDGGCAIHGFVRSRYGFPQSVGCVELPVDVAKKVYDLVNVGTQVYIK